MEQIIDGKAIGKIIKKDLKTQVEKLVAKGIHPKLNVLLVGDNPASKIYVRLKKKAAKKIGIQSHTLHLPEDLSTETLIETVEEYNQTADVHGILVQLPLPPQIDEAKVLRTISPQKDVDGLHPYNTGCLIQGIPALRPCTPAGIMAMLEHINYDIQGKEAVIVGRSNIVGKPMAAMLMEKNATCTICHSRTKDLDKKVRDADILVAAIGRPYFIKGEWIKPGAVVIDVGINRVDDRVVGDVQFQEAAQRALAITPVPGGVGPMTITMLLANTVKAAAQRL